MGSECSGHASSSRSPSSSGPVAYYNPAPPWLAGCAWAPAPRGPVWVCKSSEHAGRLASPPLSSSTDAGAAGAGVSSRHRAASVQVNDTALHRAWLQTAVDGFLTRQHCEGTWCAFKEELSHDGWGNVAPLMSPLCVCRGCSPILPACPPARLPARSRAARGVAFSCRDSPSASRDSLGLAVRCWRVHTPLCAPSCLCVSHDHLCSAGVRPACVRAWQAARHVSPTTRTTARSKHPSTRKTTIQSPISSTRQTLRCWACTRPVALAFLNVVTVCSVHTRCLPPHKYG